jgi:hypothetical protein
MPYAVVFTPEAESDLSRLADKDPLLASYVLDQAERLAQNPTELSHRGGVPFPPMQRYSFWGEGDYASTGLHLFFQYGQDEQTIWITGVGVVRY